MGLKKVALLIGHNATDKGAVAFNNESEYDFNLKIALEVSKEFSLSQLQIFTKKDDYISRLNLFNPDLVIELHFNAFRTKANGCEALALKTSPDSIIQADKFINDFSQYFLIKSRGVKQLDNMDDRGFFNLNELRQFNSFIFEPCFANFETRDSIKIITNWEDYVEFLVEWISFYIGVETNSRQNIMAKMIGMIQSWFK